MHVPQTRMVQPSLKAMAANSADPIKTVRVLVSFYLTTESEQTSGRPIHKEKFKVPISTENHTEN